MHGSMEKCEAFVCTTVSCMPGDYCMPGEIGRVHISAVEWPCGVMRADCVVLVLRSVGGLQGGAWIKGWP